MNDMTENMSLLSDVVRLLEEKVDKKIQNDVDHLTTSLRDVCDDFEDDSISNVVCFSRVTNLEYETWVTMTSRSSPLLVEADRTCQILRVGHSRSSFSVEEERKYYPNVTTTSLDVISDLIYSSLMYSERFQFVDREYKRHCLQLYPFAIETAECVTFNMKTLKVD